MDLFGEFFKIVKAFNKHRVKYALIGGVAMSYYSEPRFTRDIDILTTESEMEKIAPLLAGLGFDECAQPWTFSKTRVTLHRFAKIEKNIALHLDLLAGKEKFHEKAVGNALSLRSKGGMVKIAGLKDLIRLKSMRNSDQDKVDIKRLKALMS